MPIYDQGYQRWDGELQRHPARWWPITREGVMKFLPQRKYLILLGLAWLPMIFHGASLYTRLKGADVLESLLGQADFETGAGFFWEALSRQGLWVVVFTVMVGADLIAADRRHRALQLYFSKPITPNDYLLGKLGVIAAFQLLVSWVPMMLLWLFALMLEPTGAYLATIWAVPVGVTLYALLTAFVAGGLMLLMSSIGQRTVYIAGAWLILFAYGPFRFVAEILKALSGNEYFGLLALESDLEQVGAWIFGVEGPHEFHPAFSLLVVAAVVAISYLALRRRIRPVEVVL